MAKEMYIEEPTADLINHYIEQFYGSDTNRADEAVVRKVFETFDNSIVDNVLIKTVVLNNRYSTRLNDRPSDVNGIAIDVYTMSSYIVDHFVTHDSSAEVAAYIEESCDDIVGQFDKTRPYSFLSKYFFWTYHVNENNHVEIPIYDRYAKGMIYYLSKRCEYLTYFPQRDISTYETYRTKYEEVRGIINQRLHTSYTVREFDAYLWQYAAYLRTRPDEPIDIGI